MRKLYFYPTDTVWGIGGSIYSSEAFSSINTLKKRPISKAITILFNSYSVIEKTFTLPPKISSNFLNDFFLLETTLILDTKYWKGEVPLGLKQNETIAVRCLSNDVIDSIFSNEETAIFSTSVNLAGEDPILTYEKAKAFHQKYAPDAFFPKKDTVSCSGYSSTIFKWNDKEMTCIREGRLISEVKALCEKWDLM